MKNNEMPKTKNEQHGFYGTMQLGEKPYAEEAWPLAMKAIAKATGEDLDSVRAFLDSRPGRHLADDVHNGLFSELSLEDAINAATERWMSWTVSASMSRETGIPQGIPQLTGLVIDEAIFAESEEKEETTDAM